MIDGIFKRLSPVTTEGIHTHEVKKVNVEELTQALNAVKNDIEIAHLSFEKLYQEASYVHARLTHMETSMQSKAKAQKNKEDDEGGDGGSGSSGVVVEKVMTINNNQESRLNERITKIQEAKSLTANLLESIEKLSLHIKESSETKATQRPNV